MATQNVWHAFSTEILFEETKKQSHTLFPKSLRVSQYEQSLLLIWQEIKSVPPHRNSARGSGVPAQRGTTKDVAHSTCRWLMGPTVEMEW